MAIPRWHSRLVEMPRSERGVKGEEERRYRGGNVRKGGVERWFVWHGKFI